MGSPAKIGFARLYWIAASFGQSSNAPAAFRGRRYSHQRANAIRLHAWAIRAPHGAYDIYRGRRDASMLDLIAQAYGVDGSVVIGGPNWLEMDRFDVSAAQGRRPESIQRRAAYHAARRCWRKRFKLVIH